MNDVVLLDVNGDNQQVIQHADAGAFRLRHEDVIYERAGTHEDGVTPVYRAVAY